MSVTHTGMGSHQSPASDTDVWLTPPAILDALGGADSFDLDPCACSEPRPWPTARRHYTREDNGLRKPWIGRVWMNPPYGPPTVVGPWMRRLMVHGNGCALLFARTETALFFETVWRGADAVLFLEGRLFFCRPNGVQVPHNAGAPSCLIAYGTEEAARLAACGIPGHYVALTARGLPNRRVDLSAAAVVRGDHAA